MRTVGEDERLTYGHIFNPAFAAEISLIDPLPHPRITVYDHMSQQTRLRFLLADDVSSRFQQMSSASSLTGLLPG